ncbi:hypothetical protein [Streptomyces sp. LN245]|uniref:hypothetical protein n=1 Tax=Streptomyces sp. LN245 TaxID=3112975 RepID=UPI003710F5DD
MGRLGCPRLSALLLVAAAARLGASHAHASADAELAAYRARQAATARPVPTPVVLDFPPIPASSPADALPRHEQTLQLHQVKTHRARHRKEPACS